MHGQPTNQRTPHAEGLAQTCRAVLHSRTGHRGLKSTTEELGDSDLPTSGSASLSKVKHCGIKFPYDLCVARQRWCSRTSSSSVVRQRLPFKKTCNSQMHTLQRRNTSIISSTLAAAHVRLAVRSAPATDDKIIITLKTPIRELVMSLHACITRRRFIIFVAAKKSSDETVVNAETQPRENETHQRNDCWYIGEICKTCGKRGHLAKLC